MGLKNLMKMRFKPSARHEREKLAWLTPREIRMVAALTDGKVNRGKFGLPSLADDSAGGYNGGYGSGASKSKGSGTSTGWGGGSTSKSGSMSSGGSSSRRSGPSSASGAGGSSGGYSGGSGAGGGSGFSGGRSGFSGGAGAGGGSGFGGSMTSGGSSARRSGPSSASGIGSSPGGGGGGSGVKGATGATMQGGLGMTAFGSNNAMSARNVSRNSQIGALTGSYGKTQASVPSYQPSGFGVTSDGEYMQGGLGAVAFGMSPKGANPGYTPASFTGYSPKDQSFVASQPISTSSAIRDDRGAPFNSGYGVGPRGPNGTQNAAAYDAQRKEAAQQTYTPPVSVAKLYNDRVPQEQTVAMADNPFASPMDIPDWPGYATPRAADYAQYRSPPGYREQQIAQDPSIAGRLAAAGATKAVPTQAGVNGGLGAVAYGEGNLPAAAASRRALNTQVPTQMADISPASDLSGYPSLSGPRTLPGGVPDGTSGGIYTGDGVVPDSNNIVTNAARKFAAKVSRPLSKLDARLGRMFPGMSAYTPSPPFGSSAGSDSGMYFPRGAASAQAGAQSGEGQAQGAGSANSTAGLSSTQKTQLMSLLLSGMGLAQALQLIKNGSWFDWQQWEPGQAAA